jgi:hypothetical protein
MTIPKEEKNSRKAASRETDAAGKKKGKYATALY